jgi:hypothetical protein
MFEMLSEAIDELEIPLDGDVLADVLGLLGRLDAHVASAVGRFDKAGFWDVEGATSMVAWLRDRGGVSKQQALRLRGTGRRFIDLLVVASAARDGVLSEGQVRAVVGAVTDKTVELFAEQEAFLVPTLAGLDVAETVVVLNQWQTRAETIVGADEPPPERSRSLHHSSTFDGQWEGRWSLRPEDGAVVDKALQLASTRDVDGEPHRLAAERRADAFVDLCRRFVDHREFDVNVMKTPGRHRPHVNVIVDVQGDNVAGRVVDGPELDEWALRRILCDCTFHRVVMQGRSITLNYGMATRSIPTPLWNALVVRDQHCRFPGCDRPVHWCEGHHLTPWENGGPTDIDNLALLCSRHHHLIHRPDWHAKLLPDATLEITRPDGTTRTSHPPGQLRLLGQPPPRGPT